MDFVSKETRNNAKTKQASGRREGEKGGRVEEGRGRGKKGGGYLTKKPKKRDKRNSIKASRFIICSNNALKNGKKSY